MPEKMSPNTKKIKSYSSVTIRQLLELKGKSFSLKVAIGAPYLGRKITVSEINRPGLALSGHLEKFRSERIQIIGKGEHAYCLKEDPKKLLASLSKMLASGDTPAMVITGGMGVIGVIRNACLKAKIPLLTTSLDTASFIGEFTAFLDNQLAPVTHAHGVLVNVYGLGVLIQGDSGVGKSECALELLKRGHILVADDMVEIRRKRGALLVGSCPSSLKHYMEVRGLGIIDVELLFGVGSIMDQSVVEMQIILTGIDNVSACDRIGLEQHNKKILDVAIPSLSIPVSPGRNLAVIIEVAALNQRLKTQGYFAAKKFNDNLIKRMHKNAG
ncbi:MAG: HPr(Ser) kinase/phosphatase [bacterium]